MNNGINRLNLRVYFLLINGNNEVLVSDEIIRGASYTKFPGGGLEAGESVLDCIHREALEELGQDVEVVGHFYTTDFFIRSAFRETDQVIPIYYTVRLSEVQRFRTTGSRFDFLQEKQNEESFRWVRIDNLNPEEFAFPADKWVVKKLKGRA